jgi:hypothetical protein
MWVIFDHLRPSGHIVVDMPVIEAQRLGASRSPAYQADEDVGQAANAFGMIAGQ